ncbi:CYTH domain-containing protein [Marinomonas sp. M1K-6]|uniref:CYTH domain-containing protein n=2 Tax=Marinomonas profundi TaxID=2726122 RepID=A0A847RCB3_9GAMM|nr:CYTH domain-containing protein [Marinomonas profundi]UDV04880.1 CYTH domain-containing protein [Marinomonas profundi]
MAIELELKLMLQSEHLTSASNFLDNICASSNHDGQSRLPTLTLMNAYFDTQDGDLMQAGMALRIRAVNGQFIQTVKTRGSNRIGMHARGEWEWQLPNARLDLTLLTQVPLPESLADMAWGAQLVEVYRTDFERQVWNIDCHNTQMEVVCDRGLVTSPYGEDAICELELELKSGDEAGLYEFALQLAECVPVQVSLVSKAQKGVRLKNRHIEFPEKLHNTTDEIALAAYWYEVWLAYWEAMYFMQDEALMQPVRHSMSQLSDCLPDDLALTVTRLDQMLVAQLKEDETAILKTLAGMTQIGIVMLNIGKWLNQQTI